MRIRGLGTARRIAGWARSRLRGGPLVFGYHRVADAAWDPQKLCVSPDHFREQMRLLGATARPLALGDLVRGLQRGERLDRCFVVTIDDGYEDTLTTALPILEENGIPATVFATTGLIGSDFWWCEAQQLVEASAALPAAIDLSVAGRELTWTKPGDSPRERARLVRAIGDWFRAMPFEHHGEALQALRGAFEPGIAPSGVRAMTAAELAELSRSEHIEIGSHGVTHTSLNQLTPEEQRVELEHSRRDLESICSRPVVSCSYPNGRLAKDTPRIASAAGYTAACASHEELVPPNCDPMQLPRLWVGDWSGDRFARWLRWWLK